MTKDNRKNVFNARSENEIVHTERFENECWRDDGSSCKILIIILFHLMFSCVKNLFLQFLWTLSVSGIRRVHVTSTPPPHILFDSFVPNTTTLCWISFFLVSSASRNGVDAIFMAGACARRAKTVRFPIKCARKTFSFNSSVQMPSTDWRTDSAGCRCLFVSFKNCI